MHHHGTRGGEGSPNAAVRNMQSAAIHRRYTFSGQLNTSEDCFPLYSNFHALDLPSFLYARAPRKITHKHLKFLKFRQVPTGLM